MNITDKKEIAIGVGGAIIATEFFFSTLLPSPFEITKISENEKDRDVVRRLYLVASVGSLTIAGITAYLLKQKYPLLFTLAFVVMYIIFIERALDRNL